MTGAAVLRPADKRAAQRWLARIEPDPEGHFIWPGFVDRFGYGRIIVEERGQRVQWNAHQLIMGGPRGARAPRPLPRPAVFGPRLRQSRALGAYEPQGPGGGG